MAKKKVVTTSKNKITPTVSRSQNATKSATVPQEMGFNKTNYIWMGIGAALVALGLTMMLGGSMPSPDVWDPNIIYNPRITVVGPILILAGLVVEIYAIFK